MAYKTRPGIYMIQVCGQHLLVASRKEWKEVPRIRPIPKSWAVCWSLMEKDRTDKEVVKIFTEMFHKSEYEVYNRFGKMFQTLFSEGYLVER